MSLVRGRTTAKAIASFGSFRRRFPSAVRGALTDIGKKNEGTARGLILSKRKTGRVYSVVVRGRRVRHRASAPGESPANLSGNLQRSIGFKVIGFNQLIFGADTEYAGFLEKGTKRMGKRPYLIVAIEKNSGYAYNRLSGYVLAELL